ncbi:MAG: preprotein translocase subunit SecE [Nitrospiria bacterium]
MIKKGIDFLNNFFKDVKNEISKVTFPGKDETVGQTTVVIVFTIIVSMFLAILDVILVRLLRIVV